jgi:hypothetical protein
VLIAGNSLSSAAYYPLIQAESEFVVGLANLVSQVATAIHMRREIQAREQRLKQEAHARERIEQELHVARRIQQASLPEAVPELEGWEISPNYRPAREVGETSTTSSSWKTVAWDWLWETPQARECQQRS